ncbi:head maturation protease, ClpP-related [Ligilactobacillus ruminis]|uniref:head maturation protease, ClpP-related n=1 Tax=Ligilactobacillus ruminis TaxID=1623 RepID=UPI00147579F8|nr:head maturation protease, ClpP-related [Ligilactobacillus ruminis]NME31896.1 Clp protease ClpP [Ligilactobacillus ruminis]
MTKKFWHWVKNETPDYFGSDRILYLDGEISDETWFGDEVTPGIFKDELNSGKGNITLWINSPGGDVFAASQIYNMLMEYPYEVNVKIDALAASAASVIAMAGTKICMSPVAMLMIHNPATVAIGDSKDMQKAINMLTEVKESIINAYEIKSGLSRNKISNLMDAETWMNAKEAKRLGFADEILFADGDESSEKNSADPDEGEELMLFSRKAVTDSLLSKLNLGTRTSASTKKTTENAIPVADLQKRLSLLAH